MRKQHSHEENTNVNSTLAPLVLNVLQACEGRDTAHHRADVWLLVKMWCYSRCYGDVKAARTLIGSLGLLVFSGAGTDC